MAKKVKGHVCEEKSADVSGLFASAVRRVSSFAFSSREEYQRNRAFAPKEIPGKQRMSFLDAYNLKRVTCSIFTPVFMCCFSIVVKRAGVGLNPALLIAEHYRYTSLNPC